MATEDFPIRDKKTDDATLDVADLVRMFEESEESTYDARKQAERDRDYYDHKQLTSEELSVLDKRKQPPVIANRIQPKINFLVGLEKDQRIDPRALPRTPKHEQDADGASQALKYVADSEDYDQKRSGVWKNMLIEGAGGISVSVEPSKYNGSGSRQYPEAEATQQYDIVIRRVAWDRMFADPHSSEADYSDAGYLGVVVWMDFGEALAQYGEEGREALETTMQTSPSDTYDDKPKFNLWADKKRKRVRICQIWIKREEQWYFAEYTKGGILKSGPSPYVTDKGESDCELMFQSAYVSRDNDRYGLVRIMISLQDEINKRRSKALHLLNTSQIVMTQGAVDDVEKARTEAARPDGTIVVNSLGGSIDEHFRFNTRTDLAVGQVQLLQESKNELDQIGPNATMMGEKAKGSAAASGKAIIASQQGGMMEVGDLLDNLRHLDMRVFRAVWNRIRQFWTAEKWIRTTDDERNVKWVGMNVDPMQIHAAMQQNPQMQEKIAGIVSNVAELDCDIIIDEAPDSVTPALEQWQALVELKKYDAAGELPYRALIEAAPNLRNKDKIFEQMDKAAQAKSQNPQAQQAQQLAMLTGQAQIHLTEADAQLKEAQARKALADSQAGQPLEPLTMPAAYADLQKTLAETEYTRARTDSIIQDTQLAPIQMIERAHVDRLQKQPAI
jgi:hypothetical protein